MFEVLTAGYGEDPAQAGDLYLPTGRRGPVVCLLHGGFWRMPHGRDQLDAIARDLAGRGFAVWNLGYRRVGAPGGGFPGTLLAVDAGIDHLAVLAAWGAELDLSQLVVAGHSAGGHLALWAVARYRSGLAGVTAHIRPMAAAGLAPAADLAAIHSLGGGSGVVEAFLGGSPADVPSCYATASPRALLPLGVPQLVVHGEEDEALPVGLSGAYAAAAMAAGDPVEFRPLPCVGHMDLIDPAAAAYAEFLGWLEHHLAGLEPESSLARPPSR